MGFAYLKKISFLDSLSRFESTELPAVLPILAPPVCSFLMSGHFLTHMDREPRSVLIVDSVPNLLTTIRAFSPDAIFIFFYDEFRELHLFSLNS